MLQTDTAVLGAGFAGIGAGYASHGKGKDAILFEQCSTYGGLCGNFTVGSFTFDKAIHLCFATDSLCQKVFFDVPHYTHKPEASNYKAGSWVRHPVQNNLCALPVEERIKVIKSFINRRQVDICNIRDYKQWLCVQYGDYFAENYPEVYTRKYWKTNAESLNCNWCGGRLYVPSIDEVLLGAFSDSTPNVYYAKAMNYPKAGGYKAFVADVANLLDIRYRYKAVKIDAHSHIITFDNGEMCKYNTLVSTVPLPELVNLIGSESNIAKDVKELKATSVTIVSIGFKHKIEFPTLWFYVYDEDIPFARAYSPSIKSPSNAPIGKSSLQCEVYSSEEMPLGFSDDVAKEKTINALIKMRICTRDDIDISDVRKIKYANVLFYHGMEEHRQKALQYVHDLSGGTVLPCGRFGKWDYLWSHQAFLSGYETIGCF